jgi:hypothetical protein
MGLTPHPAGHSYFHVVELITVTVPRGGVGGSVTIEQELQEMADPVIVPSGLHTCVTAAP